MDRAHRTGYSGGCSQSGTNARTGEGTIEVKASSPATAAVLPTSAETMPSTPSMSASRDQNESFQNAETLQASVNHVSSIAMIPLTAPIIRRAPTPRIDSALPAADTSSEPRPCAPSADGGAGGTFIEGQR